jgi:hypothetical protein
MKMTVFWDVAPSAIALMMEAVSTFEMLVNFYQTNIPEVSHLHTYFSGYILVLLFTVLAKHLLQVAGEAPLYPSEQSPLKRHQPLQTQESARQMGCPQRSSPWLVNWKKVAVP